MNMVKVSVLGYIEDGCWVAHALEMDVIGVDDTWEEAIEELHENVQAQVSFAKYREDDSLIFQPAPPEMFEKFKEARMAEVQGFLSQKTARPPTDYRSDDMGIPTDIPKGEYALA